MLEEPADVDQFVRDHAVSLVTKASDGDIAGALRQLDAFRVLCAHRRGSFGVDGWNFAPNDFLSVQKFNAWALPRSADHLTANDPSRRLFNGDVGVVVKDERGLGSHFPTQTFRWSSQFRCQTTQQFTQ